MPSNMFSSLICVELGIHLNNSMSTLISGTIIELLYLQTLLSPGDAALSDCNFIHDRVRVILTPAASTLAIAFGFITLTVTTSNPNPPMISRAVNNAIASTVRNDEASTFYRI